MLNNIKQLINSKKAYMEAAEIILEDTELDDSIILNEEPEEVPLPKNMEDEEEKEGEDLSLDDADAKDGDGDAASDEIGSDEGNELPAPATPTGEPVSDDSVDIMTAEIDLTTNTPTNILPVPPTGAIDAIDGDDLMGQAVDSGFGDDENKAPIAMTTDIMSEPLDQPETKLSDKDDDKDLDINTPAGGPADEATDLSKNISGDKEMVAGIDDKQEANRRVYAENDEDDLMNAELESAQPEKKPEEKKENNDSDDLMAEAADKADGKNTEDCSKGEQCKESDEKESDDKEKATTESSLLNDDLMTFTDIKEAVDDNKIEAHEKKLEEQEKKVQSSEPKPFGEDVMMEGISLGDEAPADASADAGSTEAPADAVADAPTEDNAVTSAVKDKVDEITTDADPEATAGGAGDSEELMKKLSALTKSIEDAKALVLKGLH